jgi:patatin-like phospholipase/acyl hydrolase
VIVFQDKFHCFYQRESSKGELWYKVFDGSKWEKDVKVDGVGMSSSPSVVVFQDKLYCFHQGGGNSGELWFSVFDGSKWEKDEKAVFGISFRFRTRNPRPKETKAYPLRILSIDGGGIRGIIPLKILEYIEKETGKPIHQLFNYVGGTSTGGIIALGLNAYNKKTKEVYKAEELIKFYTEDANQLFYPRTHEGESVFSFFLSRYKSDNIENYLKEKFGEDTACQELPTVTDVDVTVYSYDLLENQPFYFNNRDKHCQHLVWQAARSTSAAPTYFPAFELKNGEKTSFILIDGGVYINNPALNLLTKARKDRPHIKKKNQLLVSLGTGQFSQSKIDLKDQGKFKWASNIFDVASMGTSAEVENQISELLEYIDPKVPHRDQAYEMRYYRFQKRFEKFIPMDGISKEQIKRIEELAEELVEDNQEQLNQLCEILVEPIEITPDSIKKESDYDN